MIQTLTVFQITLKFQQNTYFLLLFLQVLQQFYHHHYQILHLFSLLYFSNFFLIKYQQLLLQSTFYIIIIEDKMLNRIVSKHQSLFFQTLSRISTKSYYDVLEVPQNASDKDIKKKFLEKARQYHPDHNSSPQATQQFKIIKQAYETLKDAQKRYEYDTGLSVDPTEHTDIHINRQKANQKYYHNKWYGFEKKGTHQDLRDDFYSARQQRYHEYQSENGQLNKVTIRKISNRILGMTIICFGLFGWQLLKYRKLQQEVISQHKKNVLQQSINPSQNKVMKRYIQTRQQAHKVVD